MQVNCAESRVTLCEGMVRSPQVLVKSSWNPGVDGFWRINGVASDDRSSDLGEVYACDAMMIESCWRFRFASNRTAARCGKKSPRVVGQSPWGCWYSMEGETVLQEGVAVEDPGKGER